MADTFYVRVRSVKGTEVFFDVLAGKAGRTDAVASSRSFALMLLHDALRRAKDVLPGSWADPTKREAAARMDARHEASALTRALAREGDWFVDEAWMRANLDRFVKSTAVIERRNDVGDAELSRRETEIDDAFEGLRNDRYHEWQPQRWERCHNYSLRVIVADPKLAEHLEPGIEFGTSAYDALRED